MWKGLLTTCTAFCLVLAGYYYFPANKAADIADVEVVIAQYDESLSWVDFAAERSPHVRYTVYSKGKTPLAGTISLPNVGRESHTFLYHIVKNYDSLADWTVFTQAAAPSFGFRANNHDSGHMCSGVTWDNYITPFPNGEDWYMVQTVATRFPEVAHSDRFDMMFQIENSSGATCPADVQKGWSKWWTEPDHPLIQKQLTQTEPFLPPVEFYNTYISPDVEYFYAGFTLSFANGGRFAVSRDRILRRPQKYYKNLLRELSKSVNPIEGYYMETMWYDVFHPERLQAEFGPECEMPPFPAKGASNHAVMFEDANERYNSFMKKNYGSEDARPRVLSEPYYIEVP